MLAIFDFEKQLPLVIETLRPEAVASGEPLYEARATVKERDFALV